MHIANPIYDVVFKFMMEDDKVAKAFLSAIIREEVVELDFASKEHTIRVPVRKKKEREKETTEEPSSSYTVCRFDFSAKISLPDGGFKTVLIELQKAKLASDITRFRRYLGSHYQKEENAEDGKVRQIYCIFLLGHDIDIPGRPVICVDTEVKDLTTDEKLDGSNEFIQGLHHRSWIVQIRQLKRRRRNDLEKVLAVFDQENRTGNKYVLNVNEDDFPEAYRPIVRRLRMAAESEDVRTEMEMEDDYLKELQDKERLAEERGLIIEEQKKEIEEKDKTLAVKDKVIEKKDKALKEKDKTLEIKDKALKEKNKTLEVKDKMIEEKDKMIEELMRRLAEKQRPES